MQFGVQIFPTDENPRPDDLARMVEGLGFESLWFAEHTHIPVSRRTPWPAGGVLPRHYSRTYDPFVALTAAAAVTTTLRLGTGVCLVNQHHPINLAKQTASVDRLSDGRLLFGIGVGWNEDEMEHHGVDPRHRRAAARERMLAVRRLWTEEEAAFDGEFVSFSPSVCAPKPVQSPGPPVLLGGAGGPVTFRHVVEYCDGWMPLHGRGDPMSKLDDLRRAAEDAGRDPGSLDITVYGCPNDDGVVDAYRSIGVARVIFWLPSEAGADVVAAATDAARHIG